MLRSDFDKVYQPFQPVINSLENDYYQPIDTKKIKEEEDGFFLDTFEITKDRDVLQDMEVNNLD